MAAVTPRLSGLWTDSQRLGRMGSGYFSRHDDLEEGEDDVLLVPEGVDEDGRTPLDRTIDRIGMGSYQWTLLSLCGFGWMADNMWIQAIAIILPRVQTHYAVPDSYIGIVSSSMFAGMMLGAVGWGTCSDMLGRSAAFNATLFFTSVFGILASFAQSFTMLCVLLFLLGSAVGGSMPTDGTLLLEHMPNGKKYLVTALSVFFSFGAVLAAIIALLVVPQHSCKSTPCALEDNQGWKYLLAGLGLLTLTMFLCRMVFFTLHESPRYLVHAGRPQEALESLQMISKFNGGGITLDLRDVQDDRHAHNPEEPVTSPRKKAQHRSQGSKDGSVDGQILFNAPEDEESAMPKPSRQASTMGVLENGDRVADYSSTSSTPPQLDGYSYTPEQQFGTTAHVNDLEEAGALKDNVDNDVLVSPRPRRPRLGGRSGEERRKSVYETRLCLALPRWLRKPLWAWLDRVAMVLGPEWRRTTLLVWTAWTAMSLAYTMFNVFLPKLLETGSSSSPEEKSLEESLWDVVIFTIGGCPGAILGAYLIDSPLGRRWSLAGSTFLTAFFCIVFVGVRSPWAVRASTMGISLSATAMWAVLYGWTPEIFGTKVRGTACGIASALSRVGGMIAPMAGGMLLMIDRSVPVYTSVVVFILGGVSVLFLTEDAGDGGTSGERTFVH